MKYFTTILVILFLLLTSIFFTYIILDNWADRLLYETLQQNQDRKVGEEPDNQLEVIQDENHGY